MLYKNVKTGATIETICNLGGDWVLDEGDDYAEEDVLLEDEADEVEEETDEVEDETENISQCVGNSSQCMVAVSQCRDKVCQQRHGCKINDVLQDSSNTAHDCKTDDLAKFLTLGEVYLVIFFLDIHILMSIVQDESWV